MSNIYTFFFYQDKYLKFLLHWSRRRICFGGTTAKNKKNIKGVFLIFIYIFIYFIWKAVVTFIHLISSFTNPYVFLQISYTIQLFQNKMTSKWLFQNQYLNNPHWQENDYITLKCKSMYQISTLIVHIIFLTLFFIHISGLHHQKMLNGVTIQ